MTQEILYTSAPEGLKTGSRGFCTVVSTSGMAKNLADKLESMSGYRHAFPPHTAEAKLNPINFSHLSIRVGGRHYHVLSRIADAGLDYTQRSNKLAHHVALDETETISSGPAAVLATPGFCRTEWDGTAKVIPKGHKPKEANTAIQPCATWKKTTGDAGWAGVVAEHLIKNSSKPISIIFQPQTDTLALAKEVISLIPESQRWKVTFSTYFTKLPAGLDCLLRFVLDNTPEATAIRRHPHSVKIDLCSSLGTPNDSELVSSARSGKIPASQQVQPPSSSITPQSSVVAPPPRQAKEIGSGEESETYSFAEQLKTSDHPTEKEKKQRGKKRGRKLQSKPSHGWLRFWLKLLGICVILTLLVLFAVWFFNKQSNPNIPNEEDKDDKTSQAEGENDGEDEETQTSTREEKSMNTVASLPLSSENEHKTEESSPSPKESDEKPQKVEKQKPATKIVQDKKKEQIDPFEDIRKKGNKLVLPKSDSEIETLLCKLSIKPEQKLIISFFGEKQLLGNSHFTVTESNKNEAEGRSWIIKNKANYQAAGKGEGLNIGSFSVKNDQLYFKWNGEVEGSGKLLPYALLKLKLGEKEVYCQMSSQLLPPLSLEVNEINISDYKAKFPEFPDDLMNHVPDNLYLEISHFRIGDQSYPINENEFEIKEIKDEKQKFDVKFPMEFDHKVIDIKENQIPRFELKCTIEKKKNRFTLAGRAFAYPLYVKNPGENYSSIETLLSDHTNKDYKSLWLTKFRDMVLESNSKLTEKFRKNLDNEINKKKTDLSNKKTRKKKNEDEELDDKITKLKSEIKEFEKQIKVINTYQQQRDFFKRIASSKYEVHYRLYLIIKDENKIEHKVVLISMKK